MSNLQQVINQGNELLKKQQEDFQKRWEKALADTTGQSEITVDTAGFDQDIKDLFNNFAGHPLLQMVFLLVQSSRTQIKTQLLVQAMAAKLAGMDAEETKEAAKKIVSGS